MSWEIIDSKIGVDEWNEKLKQTDASFFQYPYYAEGYKYMAFSKPVYIQYKENNSVVAFTSIMQMGIWPFKIGLIIRGPVIIDYSIAIENLIEGLQKFAKDKGYMFLRVNPHNFRIDDFLQKNSSFLKDDYFPFYKGSQSKNLIVTNKTELDLLKSFKPNCRQKIRYAEEVNFVCKQVENEVELKQVYNLFTRVGDKKNFKYRSYKSYKEIFNNGIKHNLCSVYIAVLNENVVAAIYIVKDADYYTYLSGGLVVEGYHAKNSPAAKLHYMAMQDCFFKEKKKFYNISYTDSKSSVYTFKSFFNPVIEDMPDYYTFIVKKRLTKSFRFFTHKNIVRVKKILRSIAK